MRQVCVQLPAATTMLIKNDLLRYAGPEQRTIRVLWIDRARTFAYIFELETN